MKYALDKENKRVSILQANIDEKYCCPICHKDVLQKRGEIKAFHFAHFPASPCIDHWHYDMSLWHSSWQNRFKEDEQEVIKTFENKTHRADVLLENEKTVIEFQHSEISKKEYEDRNHFYNQLGYKVIWVFDMQEEYEKQSIGLLDSKRSDEKYYYHYPKKIFASFDYKDKGVQLFFHIKGEDENIWLLKIIWCAPNGIYRFCGELYSLPRFLREMRNIETQFENVKNTIPYLLKQNPDSIIIVRNKKTYDEYLLNKDSLKNYQKYHRFYGRTKDSFGAFKGESIAIKDALKPSWVLLWKKIEKV